MEHTPEDKKVFVLLFCINSSQTTLIFSGDRIQENFLLITDFCEVRVESQGTVITCYVYNPHREGEAWPYNCEFKLDEHMQNSQKKLDFKAKGVGI